MHLLFAVEWKLICRLFDNYKHTCSPLFSLKVLHGYRLWAVSDVPKRLGNFLLALEKCQVCSGTTCNCLLSNVCQVFSTEYLFMPLSVMGCMSDYVKVKAGAFIAIFSMNQGKLLMFYQKVQSLFLFLELIGLLWWLCLINYGRHGAIRLPRLP